MIFIFTGSFLNAQVHRDSLVFSNSFFQNRSIITSFDKQLNTYNFNSILNYGISFGNTFVGINEQFLSTVIKSGSKNTKDEQYLTVMANHKLSDLITAGALLNSVIYSDDRQLAINKSEYLNSLAFMKINPTQNISIVPFAGISDNTQIGVGDFGMLYGIRGLFNQVNSDDLNIESQLNFKNEDISPRKNTDRLASIKLTNLFEKDFVNEISGAYEQVRKDFYFDADSIVNKEFNVSNNIQSRVESNYFVRDRISFQAPSNNFGASLDGKVSWRDIDRNTRYISTENISTSSFDTKIEEFKIDLATNINYTTRSFTGNFRVHFAERDEKHNAKFIENTNRINYERRQELEFQKNNTSRQTTVTLIGVYNLSASDIISFSMFHRKLQYDTPSEINYDDRDELLSISSVRYFKNINPLLILKVNLEGSINKIAYIFAERSSNNNVTRVVKFSSAAQYNGSIVRSFNEAEVSANYTVYDFQDLNPNFRSFSFRQLGLKDSTSIKFSNHVYLKFYGYLKLSEQGDFNWDKFAGKPFRFLEEKYLEPKIEYSIGAMRFGIGLRHFSLLTFTYNNENKKVLNTKYTSTGPISEISYTSHDLLQIKIYGWYEFIENEMNQTRELANLFIRVNWLL